MLIKLDFPTIILFDVMWYYFPTMMWPLCSRHPSFSFCLQANLELPLVFSNLHDYFFFSCLVYGYFQLDKIFLTHMQNFSICLSYLASWFRISHGRT